MESRGPGLLLAVLVGLALVVLGVEARAQHLRKECTESFQRLVGGLGFGPATNLSECAFGFDPRLDGACAATCGPIPGGACFCPRHAGSLFVYPELDHGVPLLQSAPANGSSR